MTGFVPMRLIALAAAGPAMLVLAGCTAGDDGPGVDWAWHNGTSDETAYSPLEGIDTTSVSRLGLAWSIELPGEHMLEATPLAIDGVLYFTGGRSKVYAVDAVSGKLLWSHDPEVWKHDQQKMQLALPVNRGAAFADGRVFAGTVDGRLIALAAKSGKLLWSVVTTPANRFQSVTGAPRVFNGKVIIGQGGADYGQRGYVTAYDQSTGKQVWRFYVVPGTPEENRGDPAMERAARTWPGEFWKFGTGGGPWDNMTFDAELNRVYIATGNLTPSPNTGDPDSDYLYTNSIVSLDADTGKYAWHYQVNPRDSWDFDSTQQIALATLVIDEKPRKVLMQAAKNGFLYVIDRQTGKLVSAGKFGKANWASHIDLETGRPVEAVNARFQKGVASIWPGPLGAHNWHSMSFNPKTGLLYIPVVQAGMRLGIPDGAGEREPVFDVTREQGDGKGALVAYDPASQKVVWKVRHATYWNGGTLATGGGLVFQGKADGAFAAYDAVSGKRLWSFDAKLGIIAAPITYRVGGRQYVSVLAGYGASNAIGDFSDAGWKYGLHPRRLLTFTLDGKAVMPDTPLPDFTVKLLDDPRLVIDPADVRAGAMTYRMNCIACHGDKAHPAGAAPDLRESPAALGLVDFTKAVRGGALLDRGMPRYDHLSDRDLRQLHAYIRASARAARKSGGG